MSSLDKNKKNGKNVTTYDLFSSVNSPLSNNVTPKNLVTNSENIHSGSCKTRNFGSIDIRSQIYKSILNRTMK